MLKKFKKLKPLRRLKKQKKRPKDLVRFIKNPDELKAKIIDDPSIIFSDKVIQLTIKILSDVCKLGTTSEIASAKKTLEDIGLTAFIPDKAKSRSSPSLPVRWFRQNPETFVWWIELQKDQIQPVLKKTYRGGTRTRTAQGAKNDDIVKVAEELFHFKLNADEKKLILRGERTKDLTAIAISLTCFNPGDPSKSISFEALKDLYYETVKNLTEEEIESLKKDHPPTIDGSSGYLEYITIKALP